MAYGLCGNGTNKCHVIMVKSLRSAHLMATKLGKVYKSGGTNQQVQGNDEYVVITTSYSDGSIKKSGHIGDISIDNTFESWNWGGD